MLSYSEGVEVIPGDFVTGASFEDDQVQLTLNNGEKVNINQNFNVFLHYVHLFLKEKYTQFHLTGKMKDKII